MSMQEIVLQRIANELGIDIQDRGEASARVYFPKARAQAELIWAETAEQHPLFDEYRTQEEVFRVMKDYRFFRLCLPAIFGMGSIEGYDWVLRKQYDGLQYPSASQQDVTCPWPEALARDMAMMTFDLSQVPVLKFSKKVPATSYEERLHALKAVIESQQYTESVRLYIQEACARIQTIIAERTPTLFMITNGAFYPENCIQLPESIVLTSWRDARIVAREEVIAQLLLSAIQFPDWCDRYLRECDKYLDIEPAWLMAMIDLLTIERMLQHPSRAEEYLAVREKTLENREREMPMEV